MLTAGFACTAGYWEPAGQDGGSHTGSTGHRGQGWSKAPRSKKTQSVHPQHVLSSGASGSECRAGPLAVLGTDTAMWVPDRGTQGTRDSHEVVAGSEQTGAVSIPLGEAEPTKEEVWGQIRTL